MRKQQIFRSGEAKIATWNADYMKMFMNEKLILFDNKMSHFLSIRWAFGNMFSQQWSSFLHVFDISWLLSSVNIVQVHI